MDGAWAVAEPGDGVHAGGEGVGGCGGATRLRVRAQLGLAAGTEAGGAGEAGRRRREGCLGFPVPQLRGPAGQAALRHPPARRLRKRHGAAGGLAVACVHTIRTFPSLLEKVRIRTLAREGNRSQRVLEGGRGHTRKSPLQIVRQRSLSCRSGQRLRPFNAHRCTTRSIRRKQTFVADSGGPCWWRGRRCRRWRRAASSSSGRRAGCSLPPHATQPRPPGPPPSHDKLALSPFRH